jgi:hypothetical protein
MEGALWDLMVLELGGAVILRSALWAIRLALRGMGMECARLGDECMMQGRLGLRKRVSSNGLEDIVALEQQRAMNMMRETYSECIQSPAHSLLSHHGQVYLPPGATWRLAVADRLCLKCRFVA